MNAIPAHALILEDLPDVASWLIRLLEQRFPGVQVACAGTLAQARRQLETGPSPDVALVRMV